MRHHNYDRSFVYGVGAAGNYVSVGVVEGLTSVEEVQLQQQIDAAPVKLDGNPLNSLFDIIDTVGLKIEVALTNPKVREFMQKAGIKTEEVVAAEEKRQEEKRQKKRLLLYGGAAAVIAFLLIRKR